MGWCASSLAKPCICSMSMYMCGCWEDDEAVVAARVLTVESCPPAPCVADTNEVDDDGAGAGLLPPLAA